MEQLLNLLKENPELGRDVEAMWVRGTAVQEVAGALSKKGVRISPEQVEELLTWLNARHAEAIADSERVDKGELLKVAGGMGGTGGCTEDYYKEQCSATVELGSWCGSNDWCVAWSSTYTPLAQGADGRYC